MLAANPRSWTDEEEDYLLTYFGSVSMKKLAENLKRTVKAVESKLARLGVYGGKANTGHATVYEIADSLQVDNHTVYRWVENKGLPHKKHVVANTRKFILIDIPKFWKWAERNKDLINFYKIPKHALIPEPEWVDEQRRLDHVNKSQKLKQNWTSEEDTRLWYLYYSRGLLQKEIATLMGRSQKAIQRRLTRLREQKQGVA